MTDARKALEALVRLRNKATDRLLRGNDADMGEVAKFAREWDDAYSNARAVLATAPAEPPKDGEAARLIERLREWTKVPDPAFKRWNTALDDMIEAADALARLSAPVPDKPTHRPSCTSLEPYPFHGECDCGAVK